ILMLAGAYQLTPMKEACLSRCRSPIGFFLANWRAGRLGAIRMGLQHGLFCIGCCWMLMLLMFVGGAMSVVTMALLSMFILAERVLPSGPWVSWMPGIALIAWGAYLAIFA
ncbi:MAG TPA: metal-binding protein, partial [Gammaproteobacteria bacterium]|nr:metal-binding protein [Gammaproteobacteria bacterium]